MKNKLSQKSEQKFLIMQNDENELRNGCVKTNRTELHLLKLIGKHIYFQNNIDSVTFK